ncbi:MAG: hypothetical protein EBS01_06875 [Verrucomicrobia bacterium]|nr:hypothetical protein [Verrucomicrobiota bacterium]
MNAANVFVLGLILLSANLALGALIAPGRPGSRLADRLVWLWRLLFFAALNLAAWALVLFQGGVISTFAEAFARSAACFVFVGGRDGGFAPPWGALAPLIALNGLLFLPIVWLQTVSRRAPRHEPHLSEDIFEDFKSFKGLGTSSSETVSTIPEGKSEVPEFSQQQPSQPPPLPQTHRASEVPAPEPLPSAAVEAEAPAPGRSLKLTVPVATAPAAPLSAAAGAEPLIEDSKRERATPPSTEKAPSPTSKGWDFYPPLPKVQHSRSKLSPEEEMQEQLKPLPPTPPPIRFGWEAGR